MPEPRTGLVTAAEAQEILDLARVHGSYSLGSEVVRLATTVIVLHAQVAGGASR